MNDHLDGSVEVNEVPGDRKALAVGQRRPPARWVAVLLVMVTVIVVLGAVGYIARAKINAVIASKIHPKATQNPDEAPHQATRQFSAEPAVSAAASNEAMRATQSAPTGLPAALTTAPMVPAPSGANGPGNGSSTTSPIPLASSQQAPPGYGHQTAGPGQGGQQAAPPAPSMLVDFVQDQPGQGGRGINDATPPPPAAQSGPNGGELFGSTPPGGLQASLRPSVTASAHAGKLTPRDLLLARGAYIPCVLETQLISNIAGFTSCIVTDNIYSDDGHTLLVERGAHVVGEYKSDVHNGDTRLFVLWDRIKTKHGLTIDLDSPGGDAVGGMGLPGYVDNHWFQRIGAAFMLSVFQDAVAIEIARQSQAQSGSGTTITTTPTNTASASQDMAKEVLNSTINIPPTIYKNRGEIIMVYVARDLYFDTVYQVR